MGLFSSLFGKPVDNVGAAIRENTVIVDAYMKECHSEIEEYGDFTFEYLYTTSEKINQTGDYGSVIYIRVDSPIHEHVANLPVSFSEIQEAIDEHQEDFNDLPEELSRDKTRWLYFNMMKVFRTG
jgi:hypothetical protein